MDKHDAVSAELVREILAYDKETGDLRWAKKRPHTKHQVGDIAGSYTQTGYRQVWIGKHNYQAHKLIWLHVYGRWPEGVIDHINGVRDDNRIANLRDVDYQTNNQNVRHPHADGAVPFLGVDSDRPGQYRAKIVVNGKPKYLGRFKTPEEAHRVYLDAKRQLHAGCAI